MLTERIDAIVNITKKGKVAADIGCDHGYTSIRLILQQKATRVLACDLNPMPLTKSIENIKQYHLEDRITTILSDGFCAIKEANFDTAIISGMGGKLVIKILKDEIDTTKKLKQIILQPQHDIHEVRRYLHSIRFAITDEDIVFEAGKYYPIILAELGNEAYKNNFYYEFGNILLKKRPPVFLEYLQKRLTKNKSIISNLTTTQTPEALEKKSFLLKEIEFIEGNL